ncbi:flagellar hook-basal body protein [Vagococcus silagei]|uniref:Flagellar hook-basal body protein n=1 Tax=Vagococcus silagei TaxID=2508885 RepID=A0A4S3B4V4_9ENTE|nr:flagellar hook-basal body protein [Vagococcus silagei]THB61327.1 flagellar hook-basal body protein [Vagococcus silagei]
MIRSMDTLQSNLNILQKKQQNISSNVSNANTPGYRAQYLSQQTKQSYEMFNFTNGPKINEQNIFGDYIFGNQIDQSYRNQEAGGLKQTDRITDFAVLGRGYFNVQLPNGQTAYTKNGNFTVNEMNQLTTQEGYLVLDRAGQGIDLTTQRGTPNFALTTFENESEMTSFGQTLYLSNAGQDDNQSLVQEKMLEGSNVSMVAEMTNLIETARQFETNQKALHASDETLRYATTQVGKA